MRTRERRRRRLPLAGGSALTWFLTPLLIVGALATPGLSDEVSEALDQVHVKLRAGKAEECLKILDQLREDHGGDPRIEYERFEVLEKLERRNEAADALEDAVAALAEYEESGGKSEAVLSLGRRIRSAAADVLAFRLGVRETVGKYREKGASLARKIAGGGRRSHLLYVLSELQRVQDSPSLADDPLLGDIAKVVDAEAIEAHAADDARRRGARPPQDKEAQDLLKKNIADAQRAVLGRKYEEARLSALAALEVAPLDLTALLALCEALGGLSRDEEAAEAAVRALDAPRFGVRNAAVLCRRALAVLKKASPDLAAFQALRDETAGEILRGLKRAQQQKRGHDVEWIVGVARAVAPGDPAVEALGEIGAYSASGGPRRTLSGFVPLIDKSVRWEWKDKGPGSGLAGKELVFTNNRSEFMCMATPPEVALASKFALRFHLRYDFPANEKPPIFILFDGDPATEDDDRAFIFLPEGPHHVGFARLQPGESWKISEVQTLPDGIPANLRWFAYEIAWDDATKKLALAIGGRVVFDYTLRPTDTLHGKLAFGIAGGNEVRIRELYLRNER